LCYAEALKARHVDVIETLLPSERRQSLIDALESDFKDIKDVLTGVYLSRTYSDRTLEFISGHGELWSAQIGVLACYNRFARASALCYNYAMKLSHYRRGKKLHNLWCSCEFWRGRTKKNLIAAAAASLFVAPFAFAIPVPIQVDLGPTGVVNGSRLVDLPAPNVEFQGQNIVIDFSFQSGEFIRLFTATTSFQMDAFFRINNAPLIPPLVFAGSGYLIGSQGQLGPAVSLQAFPVTNLVNEVGVDLLLRPLTSSAVPADVYGIRLAMTLPDSPGFGFGNGPDGGITFDGNVFGIGPGVPRDIVPDAGSTLLFLAISLTGLMGARIWGISVG